MANIGATASHHESGEHVSLSFLVVEVTGKKDPQGHKFDIDCHGDKCKLKRITLSECHPSPEGVKAILSGKHVELSSAHKSLGVERLGPTILRFVFEVDDLVYQSNFTLAIGHPPADLPPHEHASTAITSFRGSVTKKNRADGTEKILEVLRANVPIEQLTRNCPIEVHSD